MFRCIRFFDILCFFSYLLHTSFTFLSALFVTFHLILKIFFPPFTSKLCFLKVIYCLTNSKLIVSLKRSIIFLNKHSSQKKEMRGIEISKFKRISSFSVGSLVLLIRWLDSSQEDLEKRVYGYLVVEVWERRYGEPIWWRSKLGCLLSLFDEQVIKNEGIFYLEVESGGEEGEIRKIYWINWAFLKRS